MPGVEWPLFSRCRRLEASVARRVCVEASLDPQTLAPHQRSTHATAELIAAIHNATAAHDQKSAHSRAYSQASCETGWAGVRQTHGESDVREAEAKRIGGDAANEAEARGAEGLGGGGEMVGESDASDLALLLALREQSQGTASSPPLASLSLGCRSEEGRVDEGQVEEGRAGEGLLEEGAVGEGRADEGQLEEGRVHQAFGVGWAASKGKGGGLAGGSLEVSHAVQVMATYISCPPLVLSLLLPLSPSSSHHLPS